MNVTIISPAARWSRFVAPAILLLAAIVAVSPQFVRGPACGDDFDFHLVSWIDCLQSWQHGILYPHWAPSANYGAGEPRFVFYPPLTWMLGAALGLVLPWTLVPIALTFLLLFFTGLATRSLARAILPDGAATLAGCAAIFSGYALYTAYHRSSFGELTGGFWIPLLLLYALRPQPPAAEESESDSPTAVSPASGHPESAGAPSLARTCFCAKDGKPQTPSERIASRWPHRSCWVPHICRVLCDRCGIPRLLTRLKKIPASTAPLALTVAACWLSNVPLGIMACYLLAAVALIIALLDRSWQPLLRSALAAALGIGLAAFYLLPALFQQRWIDVSQLTFDPLDQIENRIFFPRHVVPDLASHGLAIPGIVQPIIAFLILTMVAVALVGLLIARRRGLVALRWWLPLGLIPVAVLFLQFPVSLPLWNLLPKLRLLQFPWRWLVVLEAPMAVFFAAALWPVRRARRYAVIALSAALFLAAILLTNHFFFDACQEGDSVPEMMSVYRSGLGFDGVNEYAPPGADDATIASGLPDACLAASPALTLGILDVPGSNPDWWVEQGTCAATFSWQSSTWQSSQPERHHLRANLPHAGFLILRLRSYPAWRILLNGQPVASLPRPDDGLIAIAAPQGAADLSVDWTTTPDVIAGRSISVVSVLLLAALWFCTRKPCRPRLS